MHGQEASILYIYRSVIMRVKEKGGTLNCATTSLIPRPLPLPSGEGPGDEARYTRVHGLGERSS